MTQRRAAMRTLVQVGASLLQVPNVRDMYVECQVDRLEWAANEQPLRGETTMTIQAQLIPRNYDVLAGLDVDKRSLAVIFTIHLCRLCVWCLVSIPSEIEVKRNRKGCVDAIIGTLGNESRIHLV